MRVLPQDPGPRLIVSCDGAARGNPGPAGIGAVATTPDGEVVGRVAEGIGIATNNVAEYRAALAGLGLAAALGAAEVTLRSDSRLLIEQLAGRFRVKNPTLQVLHQKARELMRGFARVRLQHIPRERNREADAAANEGVDAWLGTAEGAAYRRPDPDPTLWR